PYASCLSVGNAIVHGLPSDYVLSSGDVLGIDLGVNYKGWYTDAATTVVIGTVDEHTRALVATTKEALFKAVQVVKPGIKVGLISSTIEAVAKQHNFGIVKNLTGHGVGRSLHEPPQIPNFGAPDEGATVKIGQALAIEPMFCGGSGEVTVGQDGWTVSCTEGIGSHHEATVLVTETGAKVLTGII
ncbi:type I methionyl aminopeptidase, partial [Candidatus Berkelbacteria bacterium]|nr:type I methionyl aminopeptidase [Candidatus Berkelbacteria bacterium]